jgi:hypothetical protein
MSCAPEVDFFCILADQGSSGNIYYLRGSTWSGPFPNPFNLPYISYPIQPRRFSCASPKFCIGMSFQGLTYVYNGSTWSTWVQAVPSPPGNLDAAPRYGPSTFCVTNNECFHLLQNKVYEFHNNKWSNITPSRKVIGKFVAIQSISCGTGPFCITQNWTPAINGDPPGWHTKFPFFYYQNNKWHGPIKFPSLVAKSLQSGKYGTQFSCVSAKFCMIKYVGITLAYNADTGVSTILNP